MLLTTGTSLQPWARLKMGPIDHVCAFFLWLEEFVPYLQETFFCSALTLHYCIFWYLTLSSMLKENCISLLKVDFAIEFCSRKVGISKSNSCSGNLIVKLSVLVLFLSTLARTTSGRGLMSTMAGSVECVGEWQVLETDWSCGIQNQEAEKGCAN